MESINALLIQQNLPQGDRLTQLNKVAIAQMKSLLGNTGDATIEVKQLLHPLAGCLNAMKKVGIIRKSKKNFVILSP